MSDMLEMLQTLGDQLRWAAELEPPEVPPSEDLIVVGMGGSGVSGDYLQAVAGESTARVHVHKEYAPLPRWADSRRPLVIAASYSGNTEETLDGVEDARARGLEVVALTTGGALLEMGDESLPVVRIPTGLQPRAAVGYLTGAVLRIAAGAGAIDDQRPALDESASLADGALAEGSRPWAQAEQTAEALGDRIAIIYGGGPVSSTVAGRWKTQINENAKMPAWASHLPELNHNELVGWETMPDATARSLAIVALADRDDHPRVGARRRFSEQLTSDAVPWVATIDSWGESRLARLMSLTGSGDLVSWMMARNAGVDPTPVATIEKLKVLLRD